MNNNNFKSSPIAEKLGILVYLYGCRVPYLPGPNDCWSNPLDEYKNTCDKSAAWVHAVHNNEYALDDKGGKHLVKDYDMGNLAYCGGIWRVQNKPNFEIMRIRDKDMVLTKKLDRAENTLFEFWSAVLVCCNCYGPYLMKDKGAEYVVAKYDTDKGTMWGYGKTLELARAYLGLKLYDEYKDVIHVLACKNKIKNK